MDQLSGAIVLTGVVLVLAACAAAPSFSPEATLPFTELPHEAPELEAMLPDSIQGTRTIAGKTVHVGSADMVEQVDHQRGIPYLYQGDGYVFLVLTDDPAWAEEALAALP
jgi:hypothetical protein